MVTGPATYAGSQTGELLAPDWIVIVDFLWPNDEEVDVAPCVAVASDRRAEDGGMDWYHTPALDTVTHTSHKFCPHTGKESHRRSGKVFIG